MYNLSAGQGPRFAEIAREMTEKIRQLGPNPIKLAKKTPAQSGAKEAA
jgi:F420-non-reducing hydrogenase iron-sulfur subunit